MACHVGTTLETDTARERRSAERVRKKRVMGKVRRLFNATQRHHLWHLALTVQHQPSDAALLTEYKSDER